MIELRREHKWFCDKKNAKAIIGISDSILQDLKLRFKGADLATAQEATARGLEQLMEEVVESDTLTMDNVKEVKKHWMMLTDGKSETYDEKGFDALLFAAAKSGPRPVGASD